MRALQTTMLAQQTEIAGLRAADHTRQAQLVETLTLLRTLQIQVTKLQSQQGPAGENDTKRTTRSTPAATTTTTTTVTDAQLKALIDQGVANALVIEAEMAKTVMI
ncbi:hypothetical protein Tco_0108689 [Tanacetum coccineum]